MSINIQNLGWGLCANAVPRQQWRFWHKRSLQTSTERIADCLFSLEKERAARRSADVEHGLYEGASRAAGAWSG
jgi:hypothetical protein